MLISVPPLAVIKLLWVFTSLYAVIINNHEHVHVPVLLLLDLVSCVCVQVEQ